MSKLIVLAAACVAILTFGAFLWFDKDDGPKKADAPQEEVQEQSAQKEGAQKDQPGNDDKKNLPVATKLPPECLAMLANPELYEKHKVKSYATIAQGGGSWYFRTETDFKNDLAFDETSIEAFKKFTDAFAQRGTTLVVTLIPIKGIAVPADAVPSQLAERMQFDRAAAEQSYAQNLKDLRAAGVHVVGVTEFDPDVPFFLKADQHWTQMGADKAAQEVAAYVKTLPVYKDLPKQKFQTAITGERKFQGKYNEPIRKLCGVTVGNETDPVAVTSPVATEQTDAALFGDEKSPDVVLVGTSNSKRDEDSNFSGALKEHLETDVNNAAIAGVGYDDPLLIYLSSEDYRKHPPKVLIWEIPSYYTFKGSKDLYRILPAAIWGECEAPVAAKTVDLAEGENTLFDTEKGDAIGEGMYLTLNFDKPVKKKFSVITSAGKEGNERTKFDVSKRTSDRLVFMMDITKTGTSKLALRAPKELNGLKATAKLCKKPAI